MRQFTLRKYNFTKTFECDSIEVLIRYLNRINIFSSGATQQDIIHDSKRLGYKDPDIVLDNNAEVIYNKGHRLAPTLWKDACELEIKKFEAPDDRYSNIYRGIKGDLDYKITINNKPFDKYVDLSLKFANHSPDGASWGYNGSGPAQFALAIMLAETMDADKALEDYMGLKEKFISNLPDNFEFKSDDVWNCLVKILTDKIDIKNLLETGRRKNEKRNRIL